jgi:TolB protein
MIGEMTRQNTRNFSITLLTVLALGGLLMAPSASAAWPGKNGAIVFQAFSSGGTEEAGQVRGIWSARAGDTRERLRQLTTLSTDSDPQPSPDGLRIVFLRTTSPVVPGKSPTAAVYTMGADGSNPAQVTDGSSIDAEPTFSAAGDRIYFTRLVRGEGTNVFSIALDGSSLRQVTSGSFSDRAPTVSPSGRLIAFERSAALGARKQYSHLFVARPSGGRPRDLTPRLGRLDRVSDPDFSPDGRRIAFVAGNDRLMTIKVNGTSRRALIRPAKSGYGYANPSYSPDGRFLLFSELRPSGRSNLRRIDLRNGRLGANPLRQPHVDVAGAAWAPSP